MLGRDNATPGTGYLYIDVDARRSRQRIGRGLSSA